MHIPDGFLSPKTYISLYVINTPFWIYSIKNLKIKKKEVPHFALLTGFSFIVNSIQFPLPGGTSIHLTGMVIITRILGLWKTYLIYSTIFIVQAIILKIGGITGFPLLTLSLGFIGPFTVHFLHKYLKINESLKILLQNFLGITISLILISLILGLQPLIASYNNKPLFFPYTWDVTLPVMLISHIPVVIIETIVSILFFKFYERQI